MAAPPDRMKVRPDMPMNSASSRRSRWPGLAQSAQPRWPPTDAISAARPTGIARPGAGSPCTDCLGGMSGGFRGGRHVGGAGAGEVERDNDPVVQFLTDAFGQRGLFEGE